jgi:hypothetical protein
MVLKKLIERGPRISPPTHLAQEKFFSRHKNFESPIFFPPIFFSLSPKYFSSPSKNTRGQLTNHSETFSTETESKFFFKLALTATQDTRPRAVLKLPALAPLVGHG